MNPISYEQVIRDRLQAAFDPIYLEIKDDSSKHAGHAGALPTGETHWRIVIVSGRFDRLSPIARHRLVYETLAEELRAQIHALQIKAMTADEYNQK